MTEPATPAPGRRVRPAGHPVVALTIAGSDPSGGAGIQADLKTFAALGGYGCAVLTGLTAQSTTGVSGVLAVPAEMVTAQLDALFADVAVDAVKIGMVSDAAVARAVAAALRTYRPPVVVVDPVMVATSGDRLLAAEAEAVVRDELLPLADLVTPNLAEAAALLGVPVARDAAEAAAQARALLDLGPRWALVKGGHLGDGDRAVDHLAGPSDGPDGPGAPDGPGRPDGDVLAVDGPRVATTSTHGTGCTLSSALAVLRPRSSGWPEAVRDAKAYLTRALQTADELVIGGTGTAPGPWHGHDPVNHAGGARP